MKGFAIGMTWTRTIRFAAVIVFAMALSAVVPATGTNAAFPGTNGKIYFQDDAFGIVIFSMNPDGSAVTQLTPVGPDANIAPVASPDGTRVVFGSNLTTTFELWTMDADGSNRVQLTTTGVQGTTWDWSPTGKIIYPAGGNLVMINEDGSGATTILTNGSEPAMSPDGSKVAFTRLSGSTVALWVINADGTGETQLTSVQTHGFEPFEPDWSPDGTKIVFVSRGGGPSRVRTINADGTAVTDLATTAFFVDVKPRWSPDGTKIFYTENRRQIIVINAADGSGATTVHTLTSGVATDWAADPSPPSGADLAAAVADSADPVAIGDTYSYTASITNTGPAAATAVTASTTVSGAPHSVVSATPSQGLCNVTGSIVDCTLGALPASAAATVTITVEPTTTGTITATTTAAAAEPDSNPGNNTAAQSTTVDNSNGCTISGTPGDDTLTGTNGDDVICGGGGNDTITGGNGNDIIYGGSGNDVLAGGNGNDIIYAGAGNDSSYGETTLEALLGLFDNGDDIIYGGPGDDNLHGQKGNDTLIDHDGTDIMSGGVGNDTINLQDGNGSDTANGGLGNDTCVVDTGDTANSC